MTTNKTLIIVTIGWILVHIIGYYLVGDPPNYMDYDSYWDYQGTYNFRP